MSLALLAPKLPSVRCPHQSTGLILSHSVPGSEANGSKQASLPSQGSERAALLKLLLVSSSADFYKVLFSGKGGIREILKQ